MIRNEKMCVIRLLLFYTLLQNSCYCQFHSEKMYWLDSMKSKDLLQEFIPSLTQLKSSVIDARVCIGEHVIKTIFSFFNNYSGNFIASHLLDQYF